MIMLKSRFQPGDLVFTRSEKGTIIFSNVKIKDIFGFYNEGACTVFYTLHNVSDDDQSKILFREDMVEFMSNFKE